MEKGKTRRPFQNPREQFVISRGWRQHPRALSCPQAQETGAPKHWSADGGRAGGRGSLLSPLLAVWSPCQEAPTGPQTFPVGSEDSDTTKLGARHKSSRVTQLASRREVGRPGTTGQCVLCLMALQCGIALGQPNRTSWAVTLRPWNSVIPPLHIYRELYGLKAGFHPGWSTEQRILLCCTKE